jgi:hypothetical protein
MIVCTVRDVATTKLSSIKNSFNLIKIIVDFDVDDFNWFHWGLILIGLGLCVDVSDGD